MKILCVMGVFLFLAPQFLCQVQAVEICEPQDVYNLMDSKECRLEYYKAGHKSDPRDAMFDIMKNYPFEKKDAFAKLLQRKIELIGNYKIEKQGQVQTGSVIAALSKLEHAKQVLLGQLKLVKAATLVNWVSVRDQARKKLEEISRNLRELE